MDKEKMYKVSILMPIFNVEEYIERSFKSILNQTMNLEDIEVIMVDDCSTDNSRDIIKKYSDKYPNFKYVFHEKNSGGCAIPRNTGFEIATGKYIMFLDPDDEYSPDMCETLYNKIEEEQVNVVRCNFEMIYPTFSRLDYVYDKNIEELKINCKTDLPPYKVTVWSAIHRKSFLDQYNIKFHDLKNAEDLLFSMTEFLNNDKMIFLNNYHGYKYYSNEEVSHQMKPNKKNLDGTLSSWYLTRDLIISKNRSDILFYIFKRNPIPFFIRLINYDGDKKEYLQKFYEFEKSLNVIIDFDYKWANILNKLIMKKQFTIAEKYLNLLNFIRNSPMLNFYRKSL